jgi:hypothetical protein
MTYLTLVTRTGGTGGFLASVRDIGVVHPPGMKVSADDTERGGAGGSFFSRGGGTNPGSDEPSGIDMPAHTISVDRMLMGPP